jgi:hypothetical protein
MAAQSTKPADACETRIQNAQKALTGELNDLKNKNNGLRDEIKALENTILILKGEKRFISGEGYDKAKWGMSAKEVLEFYPSEKPVRDSIKTAETIAGLSAVVEFFFNPQGLLYSAQVTFQADDLFNNTMNYATIDDYLIGKHGAAGAGDVEGEKTEMSGESRQDNWDTGKTRILHLLNATTSSAKHTITYTSVEFKNTK